jgi:hypothetical protein
MKMIHSQDHIYVLSLFLQPQSTHICHLVAEFLLKMLVELILPVYVYTFPIDTNIRRINILKISKIKWNQLEVEILFKVENSLHRHVLIFDQPKSYSCDVGVCEETNLKERGECHSLPSITKQRIYKLELEAKQISLTSLNKK